jgi:hypothetical protein
MMTKDQRDDGAQQSHTQRKCLADEQLDVVGHTLIGVVGGIALQLHAVVIGVMHPFCEIFAGHPVTPADLQPLVQIELIDLERDQDRGEHAKHQHFADKTVPVLLLQRVVEAGAPQVEQHVVPDHRQFDGDHRGEQAAAGPFVFGTKIRSGDAPHRRERRTDIFHRSPSPGIWA